MNNYFHKYFLLYFQLIDLLKYFLPLVNYFPIGGVLENINILELSQTRQKNIPDDLQQFRIICQIFLYSDDCSRHFPLSVCKINISKLFVTK